MSIAHHANGIAVLDLLHEVEAPFSPASAVFTHAQMCKNYGCFEIWGDRYSGEWVADEFRRNGIEYRASDLDRSAIYLFALATINSGRCELLDNERLVNQLCGLKRRTGTQGRDTIDHASGAHDDVANAACGALFLARDAGADNSLIEFEKANLAGKYNTETAVAAKFRDAWARAEHSLAHYKGAPVKETWQAGIRNFRMGETPPKCPTPECAGMVARLPHNECRCRELMKRAIFPRRRSTAESQLRRRPAHDARRQRSCRCVLAKHAAICGFARRAAMSDTTKTVDDFLNEETQWCMGEAEMQRRRTCCTGLNSRARAKNARKCSRFLPKNSAAQVCVQLSLAQKWTQNLRKL